MLRKTFYAMLTVILMMGAASAQIKPGVTLKDDKPSRTKQQKQYDKALDEAYRSGLKEIPDQKTKSDPWGDIRTTSPPAAAKNKQQ